MDSIHSRLAVLALICTAISTSAVTPSAEERVSCSTWFETVFGAGTNQEQRAWMKIVSQDVADGITRGKSWRGTPYMISGKTYSQGIAFNSTKQLLVHVGKPARRFTASVGLEDNDDTRRGEGLGQGSVTFHVFAGGKELFSTPVLRRKNGSVSLDLPLSGMREFEIKVGDGGDGRGWDQALWAEAVVTLEDGTPVRLQDIPMTKGDTPGSCAFSFQYGGRNNAVILQQWLRQVADAVTAERVSRTFDWRDPESGLGVRAEAVLFKDFPAVEWVLHFTNSGSGPSSMLENIQAVDCALPLAMSGDARLHWAKGGVASFDDFAPQIVSLKPGSKQTLQSGEGRSSSQVLPFFNLEGANGGTIIALGWSGEWLADFECTDPGEVRMKAGLQRTHLILKPGESIRTPRMLVLFYEGDRWRGQNLLRQFLLAHHRPAVAGKPLLAPVTCGNWGGTRAEVHLDNIRQIIKQELPIAYYWIDAEWYGKGSWPVNVGDWRVKSDLYPEGFKPLSDALRNSGRDLMLWFEPERVFKGTPWHSEHPQWLLNGGGDNLLFNLGDPAARQFLIDFISAQITEFGLGCYRQDFNMDPLPYWRNADAPDRQGLTEMKYIEGLYEFWDALLRRHPNLIIDNCASGGRRIDLETVGRATPFWRTDGPRDAIAHQCHSFGLLPWVPLSATSQDLAGDDYEFRSSMCSSLCLNWWVSGDAPAERIPPNFPFAWARRVLNQFVSFRDCYYGDFYPLTGYGQGRDLWMAYQLDRPDLGRGMIVVLRRPESPYELARFPVRGLESSAIYKFRNVDTGAERELAGGSLAKGGLEIQITGKPGSNLLIYERQ